MTFNVTGGKLNAILNQRSQDMLTANNWNVCQYATLVHMFAQVSGLKVGELVHVIADAHIYDKHIPIVEEIIKREPFTSPEFIIDKNIDDFYKFTIDSFVVKIISFIRLIKKFQSLNNGGVMKIIVAVTKNWGIGCREIYFLIYPKI